MDKTKFIEILNNDCIQFENREKLLNAVILNQDWIEILLENMSDFHNKKSNISARTLELAIKSNSKLILPYLDVFCELLPKIKLEGVIRSSAKIIELLTVEYFIKFTPIYTKNLKNKQLKIFTEACFDWMILNKSIAIQAHSMYALYLLGIKYNWIHPELALIIEKDIPNGSTGYKNRGRKELKAIETNTRLKL